MQREFPPKLLPSEDLKSVKIFDLKKPSIAHPSSFKALESLTGTDSALDIGSNGPSKASLATEANKNIEELHKFEVLFGRDSLRVALDLTLERPRLLKETILALARFQGTETGTNNEEEPGRIPHEIRNPQEDPIAQRLTREKGWKWPYYGSIDSTPLYISAIRKYVDIKGLEFLNEIYTAKDGKKKTIFDSLTESVSWIKGRMDQNQEGLLEFKAAFPGSHINQAWKDSADSYHHLDGAIANHKKGIASVEVQVLVYDALIDTAEIYESIQAQYFTKEARNLRKRAENLRTQVMKHFWINRSGEEFFALGTDRDEKEALRPLAIKTSNMGHLLNSRILERNDPLTKERREKLVKMLFTQEMLARAGIRTLASDEVRYRKKEYQNGSVWLWDTAYIAEGLERHGYFELAKELRQRIIDVVEHFKMFPEFVTGDELIPKVNNRNVVVFERENNLYYAVESVPQEVQAWSVSAVKNIKFKNGQLLLEFKEEPKEDPQKSALGATILKQVRKREEALKWIKNSELSAKIPYNQFRKKYNLPAIGQEDVNEQVSEYEISDSSWFLS